MKDEWDKLFDNAAKATNCLVFKGGVDGEFIAGFATEEAAYDYIDYLATISDDEYIIAL